MFEQHDDAIDLLKRDHRDVENLFAEFGRATDDSQRIELAGRICSELAIHAKVEEELFYPAARDALGHDDALLVDEATVEHGSLKQLIGNIDGSMADDMFAARMQVLQEYVQHHVHEEETKLMPAVRRADIDLHSLGDSIAQRKHALAEQAESAMTGAPGSKRVQVPAIEPATATSRATKRTSRKPASRNAKSAPRPRTTKRRAAGKRKSNPAAPRRSGARRKS